MEIAWLNVKDNYFSNNVKKNCLSRCNFRGKISKELKF